MLPFSLVLSLRALSAPRLAGGTAGEGLGSPFSLSQPGRTSSCMPLLSSQEVKVESENRSRDGRERRGKKCEDTGRPPGKSLYADVCMCPISVVLLWFVLTRSTLNTGV